MMTDYDDLINIRFCPYCGKSYEISACRDSTPNDAHLHEGIYWAQVEVSRSEFLRRLTAPERAPGTEKDAR